MTSVVTDKVIVELEARLARYNADVLSSQAIFNRSVTGMAASAEASERRIARASAGIKSALLASVSGIAAGFSVQAVAQLADGYTRFTNQLKLAGLEGANLATVQESLYDSAQRYGVQLEGLGTLYGRVAQAGKELGATQAQLLQFTNGVAAAIKIQGASAGAVQGALLQLSQALGGVNVRAEEYNSINEGARPILQAVANGSDRFKGSVNALRNAVIAGTVTSKEFYDAFLKGSEGLENQATKANLTLGASLTILNNALGRYVGQTDESLSATQRISGAIILLSNNLDKIIPALTVLIGLVGTRYFLALTASATATAVATVNSVRYQLALAGLAARQAGVTTATILSTSAVNAFTAALAANPIGLAIVAVAALTGGLFYLANRYGAAAVAARQLEAVQSAAETAIADYANAVQEATTKTGAERVALLKTAEALREVTAARIADARVNAQQRIDQAVEARTRADRAIGANNRRQAGSGDRSYSNASIIQDQAAQQQAQTAINAAVQARQDANAALQSLTRLERSFQAASTPVAVTPGVGPTPKPTKGGKTAEQLEEERLRIERRFNDDLRDANRALIDARDAQARTVQEQLDAELRQIERRRQDAAAEARERGPEGSKEYTAARVAQLTALYDLTASIEVAAAIENAAAEMARQRAQIDEARLTNTRDLLAAQRDIALTAAERAELDRRLLELSFEQEKAQLEAVLAAQESTEAERAIAQARLDFLPQLQAAQREALRRQNRSPLERLAEDGRAGGTAAGRREGAEGAVADGLDGLADSLAKATIAGEGFGDALLSTTQRILEEILAQVYEEVIVAPIADLARQGLDALFGTAATAVKTTADTQAAVAATVVATAMGRTAVASLALAKALAVAAAAAGGGSSSDAIKAGLSAAKSFFGGSSGGARAFGGRTTPGLGYDVGEHGPERFVPDVPGQIIPNLKFKAVPPAMEARGGTPMSFVYAPQINAPGADREAADRIERRLDRDARLFENRVKAVVNKGLANDEIGQPAYK